MRTSDFGTMSSKNHFQLYYRTEVFSIGDVYHYDDGSEETGDDTFMREPFVVLVKSNTAPSKYTQLLKIIQNTDFVPS